MYKHKTGVTLRKLEKFDLPFLLDLKKESWWGTHTTQIINSEDQNKWFENMPNDHLFLIGEVGSQNLETVGVAVYTDINWINRSLSISGSLFKKYRGEWAFKAFCSGLDFAFEMLNMNRVEAEVLEYHVAARLLETKKLGFVEEGKKRMSVYKCGQYYDSIILGMLRDDWLNCERVKNYGSSCNFNFDPSRFLNVMKKVKLDH